MLSSFSPLRLGVCLCIITLVGCTSIGVPLLPKDRKGFNSSMITSEEEQLLLNIVRMRFEDRPFFVSVDSITTSKSLSYGGGSGISFSPSSGASFNETHEPTGFSDGLGSSYSLNASAGFSDSPTVSFSPLQGERFTSQMLSPIDIRYIFLLLDSGWSVERLFRTTIHHIYAREPLENVSSVTMPRPPEFRGFLELLHLLRDLRVNGWIYYHLSEITEITIPKHKFKHIKIKTQKSETDDSETDETNEHRTIGAIPSINLVVNRKYMNTPKIRKLYHLLGLKGSPRVIHFIDNHSLEPISVENDMVIFQQRTFLGTLYYLRNSVDFTPEARDHGLIELSKYPDGSLYKLTDITKGLMKISVSKSRPNCDVNVKVYYRNHWFYIEDSDIVTKKTFALIQQLFNLQAGNRQTQSPILTIPVR